MDNYPEEIEARCSFIRRMLETKGYNIVWDGSQYITVTKDGHTHIHQETSTNDSYPFAMAVIQSLRLFVADQRKAGLETNYLIALDAVCDALFNAYAGKVG